MNDERGYTRKVICIGHTTVAHFYCWGNPEAVAIEAKKFADGCRFPCKAIVYRQLAKSWKYVEHYTYTTEDY